MSRANVGWMGVVLLMFAWSGTVATAADGRSKRRTVPASDSEGRSLFVRKWESAPTEAGGDGLGPLYNATSCAACHHQGGVGGAGDRDHDVWLLTVVPGGSAVENGPSVFVGELEDLHPGLKNRPSVILHEFATSVEDQERLKSIHSYRAVQTREELIALVRSRRSTPALFGIGRIDAIPDRAILAAAERRFAEFPEIKGRVCRLPDGRIGRFGWKGQTASLRDFVMAACSNELGLEVAGQHQASLASWREFDGSALKPDLARGETEPLVEFVRDLPSPVTRAATDPAIVTRGRSLFRTIGCATCHMPELGGIDGLYSDLLLHDLGARLNDSASGYYGATSGRVADRAGPTGNADRPTSGGASPTEWRTPPLWGVASSAPYLHDGRANTLDQAIRLHGGEAETTSRMYTRLDQFDRQAILAFLHSFTAPSAPRVARAKVAR